MKNFKSILFVSFLLISFTTICQTNWEAHDSLRIKYLEEEQFDSAMHHAVKAHETIKKDIGENDTLYTYSLTNVAEVFLYTGDFEKGVETMEEVNSKLKKIVGKNNELYAISLNNLAHLKWRMGDYKKAEELLVEACEIYKTTLGKDHIEYGISCNNLGILYKILGDYRKAAERFAISKDIFRRVYGQEDKQYTLTLNNLALMYYDLGNNEEAESLFIEVLSILEKVNSKESTFYATVQSNLALIYRSSGDHEKELELLLEAKDIRKTLLGKEHPSYANSLHSLGFCYRSLQDYKESEKYLNEALSIRTKIHKKDHLHIAVTQSELGKLYSLTGRLDEAIPLLENAEKIYKATIGKTHPSYPTLLINMAEVSEVKNTKDPQKLYEEGTKLLSENIIHNFSFLSEKEKELYYESISNEFMSYYSFALRKKESNPQLIEKLYNNVVLNKGLLLRSSTAMRNAILTSNDTMLIRVYNIWNHIKKDLADEYAKPIDQRKDDIETTEKQVMEMESFLVVKSQAFSDFSNVKFADWKKVQSRLEKDEAVIEFISFRYKEDLRWTDTVFYCALVITPDCKSPLMVKLFEEQKLSEIIRNFEGNNYNYIKKIYGDADQTGELYKLVWEPLINNLKKIKKVYISPSGLLHKISFPAIQIEKDILLCDKYKIQLLTSSLKIVEGNQEKDFKNLEKVTATLFGGVDYNLRSESNGEQLWKYLEGTMSEVNTIQSLLTEKDVKVNYFTQSTATEEEFKKYSSESDMIHIATHGFFYPDPELESRPEEIIEYGDITFRGGSRGFGVQNFVENENPLMRSGLVFAGANNVWQEESQGEGEDGVLTAQEVAHIDLRRADLDVLSACETGLGDIKGSEGVYGLQRAFKMAGANYLIMSLWQVPDKETAEFMTIFYQKLLKLNDINEAFLEAQKEMRKKYDPYFWAAFILIR